MGAIALKLSVGREVGLGLCVRTLSDYARIGLDNSNDAWGNENCAVGRKPGQSFPPRNDRPAVQKGEN